ncbi:MAG: helix-turn-helix domain-containing protein [Actinomycetota bacterium]|nr:helix-turn-helix domain-containing protein [Actinomycetota bacterium]
MGRLTLEQALAEVLREARVAADLSQEALANEAGLHRNYVSQLERALHSPSIATLFRLAAALGTTPSRLLRRVEDRLG